MKYETNIKEIYLAYQLGEPMEAYAETIRILCASIVEDGGQLNYEAKFLLQYVEGM